MAFVSFINLLENDVEESNKFEVEVKSIERVTSNYYGCEAI